MNKVNFLDEHEMIKDSQHSFPKGRSCLTNLLLFLDQVLNSVDEGHCVDIVFSANVNSRSRLLYAIARPSVCRL